MAHPAKRLSTGDAAAICRGPNGLCYDTGEKRFPNPESVAKQVAQNYDLRHGTPTAGHGSSIPVLRFMKMAVRLDVFLLYRFPALQLIVNGERV